MKITEHLPFGALARFPRTPDLSVLHGVKILWIDQPLPSNLYSLQTLRSNHLLHSTLRYVQSLRGLCRADDFHRGKVYQWRNCLFERIIFLTNENPLFIVTHTIKSGLASATNTRQPLHSRILSMLRKRNRPCRIMLPRTLTAKRLTQSSS